MIAFDPVLQCLRCQTCGQELEVRRRTLTHPDAYIEALEAMERRHVNCRAWKASARPVVRMWTPPSGEQAWTRMAESMKRQMAA